MSDQVHPRVAPPDGYDAIAEFYGWRPEDYLKPDGRVSQLWEAVALARAPLPEPLSYAGRPVTALRCHRKLVPVFTEVYREIHAAGVWSAVRVYAGCYEPRLIRGGDMWSMHTFGAAVDHDPVRNPLKAPPEECFFGNTEEGQRVVAIFRSHGFLWGGDFKGRKDCMHFQFGTGH